MYTSFPLVYVSGDCRPVNIHDASSVQYKKVPFSYSLDREILVPLGEGTFCLFFTFQYCLNTHLQNYRENDKFQRETNSEHSMFCEIFH